MNGPPSTVHRSPSTVHRQPSTVNRHVSDIDVLLQENRKFPPSAEFRREALLSDPSIYEAAARDPEAYWAKQAESLHWFQKWKKVLDWDPPRAKWFVGGKINISYNCVDRHIET